MKYLLVILVVAIAWHISRSKRIDREQTTVRRRLQKPEPMVHCARCGVHLPQSDAILYRGQHYCSKEHLAAASPDHTR